MADAHEYSDPIVIPITLTIPDPRPRGRRRGQFHPSSRTLALLKLAEELIRALIGDFIFCFVAALTAMPRSLTGLGIRQETEMLTDADRAYDLHRKVLQGELLTEADNLFLRCLIHGDGSRE